MKEILDHTTIKANLTVVGGLVDVSTSRIVNVGDPTADTDALNRKTANTTYVPKTDVIIGPIANLPATLAPNQIYYGY